MFHNFNHLISMHKRVFTIYKPVDGVEDEDGRYVHGDYQTGVNVQGVWESVNRKDLQLYPEMELVIGDMKIITTPDLMLGIEPEIRDLVIYNGKRYFVHKITNDVYYGNFYRIYLKEQQMLVSA